MSTTICLGGSTATNTEITVVHVYVDDRDEANRQTLINRKDIGNEATVNLKKQAS